METRATLLLKLKDPESRHWVEFYELYGSMIFHYARGKGCNDAMAKDVLQETIVTVCRKLPDFEYNKEKGKFRSWLFRVVHSRIIDAYRRERKYLNHESVQQATFQKFECESSNEFEKSWDKEWRENLLNIALDELKQTVEKDSYDIFRMLVLEERPVKEIAFQLNIPANTIYQIRHRLQKKLGEIVKELDLELGE